MKMFKFTSKPSNKSYTLTVKGKERTGKLTGDEKKYIVFSALMQIAPATITQVEDIVHFGYNNTKKLIEELAREDLISDSNNVYVGASRNIGIGR